MRSFLRKLGWLLRRRSREQDLEAELRFHLEETAEEQCMEGASPQDAALSARRDFGNTALVREDTRAAWTWSWFEQLGQDSRYALRAMRRNRVFTAMAALSLGLGIGANTAIFSFMDALLLRSLPVAEPHRLAVLNWHNSVDRDTVAHTFSGSVYDDAKYGNSARIFPYPAFENFQKSQTVLSTLFAYVPTRNVNLLIRNQAEIAAGQYVSGDFFRGLELKPVAGRFLNPDDDRPSAPPAIVLSYSFSEAHFGNAAAAVGQTIAVNNIPFTVVGVAPAGFDGVDPSFAAKFFVAIHTNAVIDPNRFNRGGGLRRYVDGNYYWIEMMGRLRPGVTQAQAQAQLAAVFHAWVETTATTDKERAHLPALHLTDGGTGIDTLRRTYSQPFLLLWIMVGLILAIACANIANLLLARAASRRKEMAVRLGMGAGRGRVIRQLLTESVLLALLGGLLGILFAAGGIRFLTVLLQSGANPFPLHPGLNWQVLAAAAALSIVTGLLFGLAPALGATRVALMPALRGGAEERRFRPRLLRLSLSQALITLQIALSALLLVGAGLFVRTLMNLEAVQLGFDRENILLFKINARQAGHRDPELTTFYSDLQQRLELIPGVRNATVSNSPVVGEGVWGAPVAPLGQLTPENAPGGHGDFFRASDTRILTVGPQFFATMRIPLIAGREFDERDRLGSAPVAIVNEAWAKAKLGDQNPLGQTVVLELRGQRQPMQVVGVAKNARYGDLKGEYPAIVYMAFWQNLFMPPDEATYALRANGDPLAVAGAVREIVRDADSRIPVTALKTQAAMVDETMTGEAMFARLGTVFAILALIIACVGLYGTIAHIVARRTSEIGIRIALGAARSQVVWLVMRQVALMAAIGLVAGITTSLGLSHLVASLLYGVKATDPATISAAIGALLVAAGIAAYLPSRRAAQIQPIAALRHE